MNRPPSAMTGRTLGHKAEWEATPQTWRIAEEEVGQQPQGQDERKAMAEELKHMPWRRSLWIWNAPALRRGDKGNHETTKKRGSQSRRRRPGGSKWRELGGRGDWCDSVRVGAPLWRSHTSRWGRAGGCISMVKPPGFFFFLSYSPL